MGNKYRQFPTTGGMNPETKGMKYSKKRQIKSVDQKPAGSDVSVGGAKKAIKSKKANMKSIMEELDK